MAGQSTAMYPNMAAMTNMGGYQPLNVQQQQQGNVLDDSESTIV